MASGNYKEIENITFKHKDYVLALPGWYPTWLDPLPGDFNQRHIKAASLYTPQIVLYVGKDQTKTLTETEVRVNQLSDKLLEYVVVYPESKMKWWDIIRSNILFLVLLLKYSNIIRKRFGKPLLLHSYIVIKGGLAGWILGKRWNIPFILSENWTIYYPADPGHLPKRNFIFQLLVKKVFKNVKRFLPVTNDLKQQVNKLIGDVPSTIVPNVVETNIFNLDKHIYTNSRFVFIHISTMIYQKNPEGLLRVFKKFNEEYPKSFLQLVGPYPQEVYEYAKSLELNNHNVQFTGPVQYSQVAQLLKQAQALVLFSRYENLPCVILEAFCCGIPVISTIVGGTKEVIDDSNGILLESEHEAQLLDAFKKMYVYYSSYSKERIAADAYNSFSYEAVGKQINEVYNEVLTR